MDPQLVIIAIANAIEAVANAVTESLKGQTIEQRQHQTQWFIDFVEGLRKMGGPPA